MNALRLYAVIPASDADDVSGIRGLDGDALHVVRHDEIAAIVGHDTHAALSAEVLRAHDRTIRDIAARYPAVLPARFGVCTPDESAIVEALRDRAADWNAALTQVRGREQMTVRLFGERAPEETTDDARSSGPGTRYLRARAAMPGLVELRQAVRAWVRAERVERFDKPPLLCAVYHLIDRGDGDAYRRALTRAQPLAAGVRAEVSGPWAAYAFAP